MPIILTSTISTLQYGIAYPLTTVDINQSNTVFEEAAGTTVVSENNDLVGLILNQLGTNIYTGE